MNLFLKKGGQKEKRGKWWKRMMGRGEGGVEEREKGFH